MIDEAGFVGDGSWRLGWVDGFVEAASFRLVPETGASRGALVERLLGRVEPDPELWEGVLIDALLAHPAAARLRTLELRLTDFDRSAASAAAALAARRWDHLTSLHFGYGFEYLYEHGTSSTGRRIEPMDHYDKGLVGGAEAAMWAALPALRTLTVEGALLFGWIGGEAVTDLRLRGAVVSDGGVLPGSHEGFVTLPALERLELEIDSDVHGTTGSVEMLAELTAGGYPALRSLDLGDALFDEGDFATLAALADASVLPQLERLRVRALNVERFHVEGEPLAALAEVAPRFAHLRLSVAGDIAVEGAARADVDRVLPTVSWR
ncbi:hypothetical protein [Catenuloplanes japonicus]|uniref:hypothetical protein n=1 Tax=Catenuloplanes japonicus TaxID=33876 RepID=UPI0018DB0D92|nr:hypothetical protein [Catenuloplanes japonicus]